MIEQVLHQKSRTSIATSNGNQIKGSAGIDGMRTDQLIKYLETQKYELLAEIKGNEYLPQPILGVEIIPKGGGRHGGTIRYSDSN